MNIIVQFFAQNAHFAVNLLAALVMLMIAWLHFDAWLSRKNTAAFWKWLGFFVLALSFIVHATSVEQTFVTRAVFGSSTEIIALMAGLIGYGLIIYSQLIDPLQAIPETSGLRLDKKAPGVVVASTGLGLLKVLIPLLAATVAALFWRRATAGLERHLKPVALGFLLLTGAELLSLAAFWRGSSNITIFNLTAPFGPLWILEHLFLLAAVAVLGRWVWQYLVRRLQSQLFMIFTITATVIFLVVTTSFTSLLMKNVVTESLSNLGVATRVLNYALASRQAETLAHVETIAQNPLVAGAVAAGDHDLLVALTKNFLAEKKQSSLIITNADGQVLLRAEDPERFGDSISNDTLVKRTLVGLGGSTITTQEGVAAPLVHIRSMQPIKQNDLIIGSVGVGLVVGDEFVDGIKKATGLETTVYAGEIRSATTFVGQDSKSRLIGVKESDRKVTSKVLQDGQEFRGDITVLNAPYLAVFAPLKDVDNAVVGMLFAGKPQVAILQAAGQSIQFSFLIAALLMLLSIIPGYFISRHIARQLE